MNKQALLYVIAVIIIFILVSDWVYTYEAVSFIAPLGTSLKVLCQSEADQRKLAYDLPHPTLSMEGATYILLDTISEAEHVTINSWRNLDHPFDTDLFYPNGVEHRISKEADDAVRIWVE